MALDSNCLVNNWRGRPLSVAHPDGTAETFEYNGKGRCAVRHVDALGREDVYRWVLGLPVHAGRVIGGVTNTLFGVEHDQQLNVVAIVDPLGRRAETYVLDENERVVAVTNVEGQAMARTYAVGSLVSSVGFKDFYSRTCAEWCYKEDGRVRSPMSLRMLFGHGTDPLSPDSDFDGLGDGAEVNALGTDPLNPDTDGDGMADGWEHSRGFSPVVDNALDQDEDNDADSDPDGDGLSNAEESDWGTDPGESDTDGDWTPDGAEVSQSSDPADESDMGAAASRVVVHFEFGDPSQSRSEKYALRVRPVRRTHDRSASPSSYCWVNREYGECETRAAALRPGWLYEVSLVWVSCRESGEDYPDPDYRLRFPPSHPCPASVVLEDPQGLFQNSASVGLGFFQAEGKAARLHVLAPPVISAPHAVGVNDDDDDGTPDLEQQGEVPGDDDLAEVTVSAPCPQGADGVVSVSLLALDGTLWKDRAKTECVEPGVADTFAVSATGACSRTYYFEGERASPRLSAGNLHVDFACNGTTFTNDHALTVVERVAEPVTTLRSQGRVVNPCCAVLGETVTMRVEVSPADFPDSEIRWSVVSGAGTFPGGGTGREVEFAIGGEDGDMATLRVDVGDCPGNAPQFALRATTMHEVKIYPCAIYAEDDDNSMTAERLNGMLNEVNVIYRQVGMHFSLGAGILCVTNDIWARKGLSERDVGFRVRNIMSGSDGLEVYFIPGLDNIDDDKEKEPIGQWSDYGIIVRGDANAKTMAHEIGHACGWCDIYAFKRGYDPLELRRDPCTEWLPGDWNNGTGRGFYPALTSQRDIIFRLLMYGHGSSAKSDIPWGSVYGLPKTGGLGNLNVGRGGVMTTSPHSL